MERLSLSFQYAVKYPKKYKYVSFFLKCADRLVCFLTGHDWHFFRRGGKFCKNCNKYGSKQKLASQ